MGKCCSGVLWLCCRLKLAMEITIVAKELADHGVPKQEWQHFKKRSAETVRHFVTLLDAYLGCCEGTVCFFARIEQHIFLLHVCMPTYTNHTISYFY
jgi:hypothetical protein